MSVFRQIRWRIALPYVAMILVAMGGLTVYVTRQARDAQMAALRATLLAQAEGVARVAMPALNQHPGTDQAPQAELDALAKTWSEMLQARVTLVAADGTVLGESDDDPGRLENHLDRPEIQQALATGRGDSSRFSETLGIEMIYSAVSVQADDQTVGFVRLAYPLSQVEANVSQLRNTILSVAIIVAVVATAISVLIAGQISGSVRRLSAVTRRMAAGDLDARLYTSGVHEVAELTRTFNHMADQLRARVHDLAGEQRRLAAVLDNMADGVIITDSAGRVSLINPAAARLLDVEAAPSIGRTFAEVARHHELIALWQRGCVAGAEEMGAVEMARGGSFVQMIVTSLETAEEQSCLVILQDLTRIRRLETVRRDFISNISHELRTPLASLKALVETLRDSALDDPPAARRFLDQADQEVDALSQMVQELLELARIESGKVPLRLAPTRLEEIIIPPVDRLRAQAERSQLHLDLELGQGLPPVLADAGRVQQVVSNLVHNAIKFTPHGGAITIAAVPDLDQGLMVISIKDTGVGFPAADAERIFERFYKADRARSGGGTGLGLAIARHLVRAHGGRIWAKGKEGRGSTFYFSLPLADEG
jgi:two-component system, OmpR family, phosphate regulon sensor histidine kinase PhoR